MKRPLVDWKDRSWTRNIYSPDYLEHQIDDWSCGLFVIMALLELSNGEIVSRNITNKRLDEIRLKAINLLLEIP